MNADQDFFAPSDLAAKAASLGKPIDSFGPSRVNLIAGTVIGGLFAFAGFCVLRFLVRSHDDYLGVIPVFSKQGPSWVGYSLVGMIGVVLSGAAGLIWHWVWSAWWSVVLICPGGLVREISSKVLVFPWKDVQAIRETITTQHLPILIYPFNLLLPTRTNRTYLIRCQDRRELHLDGNMIGEIERFGKWLRDESAAREIQWELVEVRG